MMLRYNVLASAWKQARCFERFPVNELSVTSVEDVKPSHIKSFLSMMDDAGRKPQYMLIAYNAKNKYRLPIKKLYGSQREEELDDEETDDDTATI